MQRPQSCESGGDISAIDSQTVPQQQSGMTNLNDLTTDQIRRIIVVKKKIEKLHATVQKRVEKLHGKMEAIVDDVMPPPLVAIKKKKRRMSKAVRDKIAAAARARWAKVKAAGKKAL